MNMNEFAWTVCVRVRARVRVGMYVKDERTLETEKGNFFSDFEGVIWEYDWSRSATNLRNMWHEIKTEHLSGTKNYKSEQTATTSNLENFP